MMQARALHERAAIDLEDTSRRIELEVRTAFSNFREAAEVLKSQEKVVEQGDGSVAVGASTRGRGVSARNSTC